MLAVELQELVRIKVDTSKFSDVYNSFQQQVLSVRRDRPPVSYRYAYVSFIDVGRG